jgi:hypothetical protein
MFRQERALLRAARADVITAMSDTRSAESLQVLSATRGPSIIVGPELLTVRRGGGAEPKLPPRSAAEQTAGGSAPHRADPRAGGWPRSAIRRRGDQRRSPPAGGAPAQQARRRPRPRDAPHPAPGPAVLGACGESSASIPPGRTPAATPHWRSRSMPPPPAAPRAEATARPRRRARARARPVGGLSLVQPARRRPATRERGSDLHSSLTNDRP